MSTQRIEHTVQGYTYKRPQRTNEDAEFPLGPEQSKSRQEETPDSRDGVRGVIRSLLDQVPGKEEDRHSFKEIVEHHESMQRAWNEEVGHDLEALGVDISTPFRLMYDPAGAVTVAGDHPGKEMINAYFTTNPGRVEELGDILQVGKLASAAEARLAPQEMEQSLQTEAMAWWYSANMDTSTLFSGGGLLFGTGGTVYKGIDIRV